QVMPSFHISRQQEVDILPASFLNVGHAQKPAICPIFIHFHASTCSIPFHFHDNPLNVSKINIFKIEVGTVFRRLYDKVTIAFAHLPPVPTASLLDRPGAWLADDQLLSRTHGRGPHCPSVSLYRSYDINPSVTLRRHFHSTVYGAKRIFPLH